MSKKINAVMYSLIVCIVLLMVTGCNKEVGKEEIAITKQYIVGKYGNWNNEKTVSVNDIATDLLTDVSWKAKGKDGKIVVTLKGKLRTEFENPVFTEVAKQAFTEAFASTGVDISKVWLTFDYRYEYGSPHYIGGTISAGNVKETLSSEEERALMENALFVLEQALIVSSK